MNETIDRIVRFLKGELSEKQLKIEESQKAALWKIRDILLNIQQRAPKEPSWQYHRGQYLAGGAADEVDIAVPAPGRAIELYGYTVNVTNLSYWKLTKISPDWSVVRTVAQYYLAARGGVVVMFIEPLVIEKDYKLKSRFFNQTGEGMQFDLFVYGKLNCIVTE